ncbi:MAG TPA: MliC family protein [Burkholderiales bacterium]
MRRVLLILIVAALAACAALERTPRPVRYECDAGKRFMVTYHPSGDTALIEINQMQFSLRREASASGARYSCDVLTLSTKGREATLEMEGARAYSNCREAEQAVSP